MATYICSAELQGKTLAQNDTVIFRLLEKILIYSVKSSFLSNNYGANCEIFSNLKLDSTKIAEEEYGYKPDSVIWPECKQDDYKALTRLVIKLYKIIEGKTSTTSEEKQWYKITTPGKTGISPEQVKELIIKYGGKLNTNFNYNSSLGIYFWKRGEQVCVKSKDSSIEFDAIEVSPTTEITTTKKEEKHENQFQRKKARIERGTRPEGSTVCGRRSKASVAIGHLGYRKVTGI